MLKTVILGTICASAISLTIDQAVHRSPWTEPKDMTQTQKDWDNFFRDKIPAIGDSEVKKAWGDNRI